MRILWFIIFALYAHAIDYIKVTDDTQGNITPQIYYYLDTTSTLTLSFMHRHPRLFEKSHKKKLLFGYKYKSTLWLKVPLKNESNTTITKVLEYDYPIQEYLWFYDGNKTVASGYRLKKFPSKYIMHPYFVKLAPHEKRTIYIKAQDKNVGLIAKLNLLNVKEYFYKNENAKIFNILFFGAILALIIYNAYLFVLTKDSSYVYYVIMVGSFFILELFEDGFFSLFIKGFYLDKNVIYFLLLIVAEAIVGFTVSFLEIKKRFPKIYMFLQGLAIFLAILFVFTIAGIIPTVVQRLLYIFLFFIVLMIGYYTMRHGVKQAHYYLYGWIFLFIYALLLTLHQAGFLDWLDYMPYLGKIAVFTEAILFSMALSARINAYKQEREEAIKQLLQQKQLENVQLEAFAEKKTAKLRATLEEKELLLKEVHHRVKNNLQIIISLLRLQADTIGDEKLAKILGESENRIRALSGVHEMLYKTDSLARIDTKNYFTMLAREILRSLGDGKDIRFDIESDVQLPMDKAIYCGLIVNELITNSLKHAFDENGGTIHIHMRKEAGEYILIYEDDGKGMNEEAKRSLGTILIQTLVERQLKGKIRLLPSEGTKYLIRFMESSPSPKIATKQ